MINEYTLLIEGIPWAVGNQNALPSFASGRIILGGLEEEPKVETSIDPFGGFAKWPDLTFTIIDLAPERKVETINIVETFRWDGLERGYKVIASNGNTEGCHYQDTTFQLDSVDGLNVGDIVYLPKDTAQIISIDSTNSTITVQRGLYPVYSEPFKHYYFRNPSLDYIIKIDTIPRFVIGRWVGLYKNGELIYLGVINGIKQTSAKWKVETLSLFTVMRQWKLEQIEIKISENDNFDWDILGQHQVYTFANEGTVYEDAEFTFPQGSNILSITERWKLINHLQNAINQRTSSSGYKLWITANQYGIEGFEPWRIETRDPNGYRNLAGCRAGYTDSPDGRIGDDRHYRSWPLGWPNFGLIAVSNTNLTSWAKINKLVNKWIKLPDGRYLGAPGSVVRLLNKNLAPLDSLALTNNEPIVGTLAAIYEGPYNVALQQWLTADNGLGLGLPNSLIDNIDAPTTPIILDATNGWGNDNLRAWRVVVGWFNGKISAKRLQVPQKMASATQVEIAPSTTTQWGRWAPVSRISYTTSSHNVRIGVEYSVTPQGGKGSLDLQGKNVWYRENIAQSWGGSMISVLRWVGQYIPTVTTTLPGTTLAVGDIVLVEGVGLAGKGQYDQGNIPGVVLGVKLPWTYTIGLNPAAIDGALWAPGWKVESQSGDRVYVTPSPNGHVAAGHPIAFRQDLNYSNSPLLTYVKRIGNDYIVPNEVVYMKPSDRYSGLVSEDEIFRATKALTIAIKGFNDGNSSVNYPEIWSLGFYQDNAYWRNSITCNMHLGYYDNDLTVRTVWSDNTQTVNIITDVIGDLLLVNIISSDLKTSKHYVNGNWYIHNAPSGLTVKTNSVSGDYPPSFCLSTYYQGSNQGALMVKYYRATIWVGVELNESEIIEWANGGSPKKGYMAIDWHWDGNSETPYNLGNNNVTIQTIGTLNTYAQDFTQGDFPHFTLPNFLQSNEIQQNLYVYGSVGGVLSNGQEGKKWL